MNYDKIYVQLITKAKIRQKTIPLIGYSEEHHIIPKCIAPQFKNLKKYPWNCAILTPEEHYFAHLLLVKMKFYRFEPNYYSLVYGANMMCIKSPFNKRGNKVYGWLKRKFALACSKRLEGKTWEELHGKEKATEMRILQSTRMSGSNHPNFGKIGLIGAKNPMFGKKSPNISQKGKTYEELYGEELASKKKKIKSEKYTGIGNPMSGKVQTEKTKKLIAEKRIKTYKIVNLNGSNTVVKGLLACAEHLGLNSIQSVLYQMRVGLVKIEVL